MWLYIESASIVKLLWESSQRKIWKWLAQNWLSQSCISLFLSVLGFPKNCSNCLNVFWTVNLLRSLQKRLCQFTVYDRRLRRFLCVPWSWMVHNLQQTLSCVTYPEMNILDRLPFRDHWEQESANYFTQRLRQRYSKYFEHFVQLVSH